jgi:hypothetical protein
MKSARPTYVKEDGSLSDKAPKAVQEYYAAFLATSAGRAKATQFVLFKATGKNAEATAIIEDFNDALSLVDSVNSPIAKNCQAESLSSSPRKR